MADEVIKGGFDAGGTTPAVTPGTEPAPNTEPTVQAPTNSVVARRKKRSVEEALDRIATKLESMSSGGSGGGTITLDSK